MVIAMEQQLTPLFKQALGEDWQKLHPAIRKHYDLRPGQSVTLNGTMDKVSHSSWVKPLIWIGRMFGALVPYNGTNIPVEVKNVCPPQHNHVHFLRHFAFPGRPPYPFNSRMEYWQGNSIVEFVRFGLGIRMKLSVVGNALRYETDGYIWRIGKLSIALPDNLFFGRGEIWERGIDKDRVDTEFTMIHPLYGATFHYGGQFQVTGP